MDKYLGLGDFDWIQTYTGKLDQGGSEADEVVAKIWATIEEANASSPDLNNYVGVYKDPWFGKIEIYEKENQLWFKSIRSPKLTGQMHYYNANAFVVKWTASGLIDADAFVIFHLDEEGKAQGIKMKNFPFPKSWLGMAN